MGEYKAGALFLTLVVYFVFLISLLSLAEFTADKYGFAYGITSNGNESLIDYNRTISQCQQPRYNLLTGEELTYFVDTTLCEFTRANIDLNSCNLINGCNLENETFLFFFPTNDQYCGGNVNLTGEFGINESLYEIGGGGFKTTDVPLNSLLENKEQCEFFGFTYNTDNTIQTDISIGVLFDIVGDLFTFQATFTDDFWLNFILTTILFYIPFIALLIALYFALPFLH